MVAGRPFMLRVEEGSVLLSSDHDVIDVAVVKGSRWLEVSVNSIDFFEVLAELVKEDPWLLTRKRSYDCGYYGCHGLSVPDMELIAEMLHGLAAVLRRAPRPVEDEDGTVWSMKEERAAKKAALLLDIAAMMLKHPETVEKLPEDVDLLVRKHEEGTLLQFLEAKSEAGAR